jgi:hypothetical protein
MPVAAPVTRAVFPLMGMSYFLKQGGKLNRQSLRKETPESRTHKFLSNLLKYVIQSLLLRVSAIAHVHLKKEVKIKHPHWTIVK